METFQNFIPKLFRNKISSCDSETNNEAFIRIKKRIRRARLKETIGLCTEILLLLLTIMLLVISIYYFFLFELKVL
ncbi:MAG: hypothetical protein IPL53_21225 [Ignavibacteria bacterium]|nr:hypothetical protein [Ignavibacteria bacterium]